MKCLFSLMVVLCLISSCKEKSSELFYLPQDNDEAIIFTHRFNANDFQHGKQILVEKFSEAIKVSGQTRRTYFMTQADSSIVVTISFFHSGHPTNIWLNSSEREAILKELRPLFREPLEVGKYHVSSSSNTHGKDAEPEYLPEKGDQVILFNHLFSEENFSKGQRIIETDFPIAQKKSGQIRRNYFLSKPNDYQIITASFFHPESSSSKWLNLEERMKVLNSLTPLFSRPIIVTKYKIEEIHDTK